MQKHIDTKGHAHRHTQYTQRQTETRPGKTHTRREFAFKKKKRKDTRAQEAWVLLYKILEKKLQMYKGKESACPMDYSPHGYQVVLMKVLFEPYSNGLTCVIRKSSPSLLQSLLPFPIKP